MKKYSHYFILLLLNILIAVSVFGMYFLYQKVQNALNTQERIKLEQEIQTEQINNLPELAERYQTIAENEQYFTLLYTEDQVVNIIKDIERLAREQQVALVITQKEIPAKKKPAKEKDGETKEEEKPKELGDTLPYEKQIRLELKAEGRYLAIRNFLHKVETSPYALDVLALQANLAPVDEETASVSRPTGDSPFLLLGTQPGEEAPAAPTTDRVIFLIETALYIQ
jgi:hypothetical protein